MGCARFYRCGRRSCGNFAWVSAAYVVKTAACTTNKSFFTVFHSCCREQQSLIITSFSRSLVDPHFGWGSAREILLHSLCCWKQSESMQGLENVSGVLRNNICLIRGRDADLHKASLMLILWSLQDLITDVWRHPSRSTERLSISYVFADLGKKLSAKAIIPHIR